ncbi:MAG: efflux RND transporter periplasmic adaptor subunit [Rhodothermaceae bacterium]|nr:efflux RND transporter periplasmic adaptor subunit [Rhodothermaceae bacterium]MYF63489.1 efflux RND transporter periplasmic adaptor subunit [Rhodothermaceae bacterium]MYI84208.1 efflux RND transporter periplasmic adaptor subunit [Rhodothermaceae bacterium]
MKRGKLLFIVGVIVAGAAVLAILRSQLRSDTSEPTSERVLPFVTTVVPTAHEGRVTIRGNGTVRPLREVTLISEVSGKITWVADEFVTGGAFSQGEEILRIDSTDYANAVTVAQAEVIQRQFDLLRAEEEMAIAREEWGLLESRTGVQRQIDSTELGSLVFKEPHWRAAIAQLQGAQARLQDAEARLKRTHITAPYNGRLRNKGAELGQFVGAGHVIASFYGTDIVEISVPIAGRDITLLGDLLASGTGTTHARLVARNADGAHEWIGSVHRTEGILDESTRTLSVIVRVRKPYESSDVRPPLLIGTFVTAYLEGRHFDHYYTLPRETLREGDVVWIVREDRLHVQPIEIIQEVEDSLYVLDGITVDDQVVTNMLNAVTDGMRVRAGMN